MISIYLLTISTTFALFFIFSIIFKKLRIVDRPDGIRKIHKGEIPLAGGVTLFFSGLVFYFFSPFYPSQELLTVFFVSIIILLLGLWDDIKPLPTSVRLIIQIFASWLVIILSDVYLVDLGDLFGFGNLYLGQLGIPLTIFMVVGVCNAFNMLDGMDGLVGFVILVCSSALVLINYLNGGSELLFMSSIMCTIFLLFNLGLLGRKWKIFLGDSGSMWLGFLVAWYLIILSQGESKLVQPVTALWLIMLPLIDALSTFLSRLWNNKSMFLGDRTHIHFMLIDAGLKKWKVLLILLIISISSAGFGVFSNINLVSEPNQFYGFLTLWFFYFLLVKYPVVKNIENKDHDI